MTRPGGAALNAGQVFGTRCAEHIASRRDLDAAGEWSPRLIEDAVVDIDATAVLLTERYGVTAGDRVGIVAANHAEYAILMWATVTLGAIVTSLSGWWTTRELEYGIGLTTPVLIAGDERRLARLDGVPLNETPVRLLDDLQAEAREFAGNAPAAAAAGITTEDSPAVILFTSTTARLGRTGQLAYAVANEVLNKTAQVESRRRPNCKVVALNWGPWEGGMVTLALRKMFENEGIGLIPLAEGSAFLVHELNASGRSVEVIALGTRTHGSGNDRNTCLLASAFAKAACPS